jgi:hypothetical protein
LPRLDLWLEELFAAGAQALEGAFLILLHEAGVADHIGSQDGG